MRPRVVFVCAAGVRPGAPLGAAAVIGVAGGMPWRIPEDLRFFRRTTLGTVLVMGRGTFESKEIRGRPLPGRTNIVVTRHPDAFAAEHPGVPVAASIDAALGMAERECARLGLGTISVIGGGNVYAQAMDRADEMLLTFVPYEGPGDTFFPAWDPAEWEEVSREPVGPAVAARFRRRVSLPG